MHCLPGMVSKIQKRNAVFVEFKDHMVLEITAKIAGNYKSS